MGDASTLTYWDIQAELLRLKGDKKLYLMISTVAGISS